LCWFKTAVSSAVFSLLTLSDYYLSDPVDGEDDSGRPVPFSASRKGMVAGGDWSMMQSLTSRLNLKNCGFEDSSKGKPLNYSHSWDKRFIKKTQKKIHF
jgi:hypothetical protein